MGTMLSLRQILRKKNKRSGKHSPKMEIFNIYLTDKVIEQDYEVVKSRVIYSTFYSAWFGSPSQSQVRKVKPSKLGKKK